MPFGPWPGVPSGGGGGVATVSVISPITDSGTVTNPDIGLSFDGVSLKNIAGVLTRGALGDDVNNSDGSNDLQVIAVHETSGPTRLAINAIPDEGAGHDAVLVRPGGTGTITGIPVTALGIAVSVTAPITNSGTAIAPNIGLAEDGTSLEVAAGILQRGPLGKDVSAVAGSNSVDVIAIEETSGPTRLAINSIPDAGAGFDVILVRPGGTANVNGVSNADLGLPLFTIVYHLNAVPAATLFASGWAFPGTQNTLSASLKIEALLPPRGRQTRITGNIEQNTISAGAMTFNMTRNGSVTGPNTSLTVGAGATGLFDSGLISPVLATNDTFGCEISSSAQLATGVINGTITIFVY